MNGPQRCQNNTQTWPDEPVSYLQSNMASSKCWIWMHILLHLETQQHWNCNLWQKKLKSSLKKLIYDKKNCLLLWYSTHWWRVNTYLLSSLTKIWASISLLTLNVTSLVTFLVMTNKVYLNWSVLVRTKDAEEWRTVMFYLSTHT